MDALLQQIANYIGQLAQIIANWFVDRLNQIIGWISGLIGRVYDALQSFFAQLVSFLERVWNTIYAYVTGIIQQLATFVSRAWEAIVNATVVVIERVQAFVNGVVGQITALVQTAMETIRGWIGDVTGAVRELAEAAIERVAELLEFAKNRVVGWIVAALKVVTDLYDKAQAAIVKGIQALIADSESLVSTIADRLGDLRSAFEESFEQLAKSVTGLAEEQLKPLREAFEAFLDPIAEFLDPEAMAQTTEALLGIVGGNTLALGSREDVKAMFQRLMPDNALARNVWVFIMSFVAVFGVFQGVLSANAQVVLQELGAVYPYQLLDQATTVRSYRRGLLTPQSAIQNLKRSGISEGDALILLQSSGTVPPPGDVLSLWLRGIISEDLLDSALKTGGYDTPWPGMLKEAAQVIPPIQDLITMAVREAFSPDVAQAFGQFEDYPEAVTEWGRKQGLSDAWLRKYWAAHWSLPSVQMGFEMLHRGAIPPESLDLLLRASDVMPYWRGPLKAIAYAPFTRVDIRRMHAMGILADEDLVKAHLDLGYDPVKAGQLAEFTKRLNKGGPSDDPEDLGKLSRSTILGFYSDGVLKRDKALALLLGLNLTPDAANLYLDHEDFALARARRKAETDLTIELATAGTITFEEAQDRLRKSGLSTQEIDVALTRLLQAQARKTKLPSLDDARRFLKLGFIAEADFRDILSRLGYSVRWINVYVTDARRK